MFRLDHDLILWSDHILPGHIYYLWSDHTERTHIHTVYFRHQLKSDILGDP